VVYVLKSKQETIREENDIRMFLSLQQENFKKIYYENVTPGKQKYLAQILLRGRKCL
jgi:hypothetical protein